MLEAVLGEGTLGSDDVEDNHHDDHLVGGGGGTVDSAGGGASPDLEPKIPRISCKIPTASIYKFENCRLKLQSSPLSMEKFKQGDFRNVSNCFTSSIQSINWLLFQLFKPQNQPHFVIWL